MATLVDGLGFEELGDAGDPGSKVATLFLTGSITTQSDLNVAGTISGVGTVVGATISGTTQVVSPIFSGNNVFYNSVLSGANARLGSIDSIGGITALQSISGQNIFAQTSISGGADGLRTGSIVSTGGIEAIQSISGLNVLAQASGVFARVSDGSGAMFSISTGSATTATHGPKIQVGSTETGAEGFGSCIFESHFANQGYFWAATLGSNADTLAAQGGSREASVSGTTPLNISGFIIKGAASAPYTWVAIGL